MKETIRNNSSSRARLLAAGLGIAVAASMAGCSADQQPKFQEGTVVKKTDTPAHDWTYMEPIPHTACYPEMIGKIMEEECNTTYTYVPLFEHADESWSITIQNCNVDGQKAGQCFTKDVPVSNQTYESVQIGDNYTVPQ